MEQAKPAMKTPTCHPHYLRNLLGGLQGKGVGFKPYNPFFSGFQEKGPVKSSKLFLMHTKAEWFLRISNFPTIINWAETLTRLLETTKQLQKNRDLLVSPVWIEFNC